MNEIAKISENNYFLTHSWYLDDMGLKRNIFEIFEIKDGMKIIYPFFAPTRVSKINKDKDYLGEDIAPYENFEYSDMLREQVKKITNN